MLTYTYRLNTNALEGMSGNSELTERKIKVLWFQLAFLFFEKGRSLLFKYWPGDLASADSYSAFGIPVIKELATQVQLTADIDGLCMLEVDLNRNVKNFVLHNIHTYEKGLSPFFHFDVLDENGESLCIVHDFGESILMVLTVADMRQLVGDGFDLNFLISLPETF